VATSKPTAIYTTLTDVIPWYEDLALTRCETAAGYLMASYAQDEITIQRSRADSEHPDESARMSGLDAELEIKRGQRDTRDSLLAIGQPAGVC
jgi:hypothetical protein